MYESISNADLSNVSWIAPETLSNSCDLLVEKEMTLK